jgi:hypothetical protein
MFAHGKTKTKILFNFIKKNTFSIVNRISLETIYNLITLIKSRESFDVIIKKKFHHVLKMIVPPFMVEELRRGSL